MPRARRARVVTSSNWQYDEFESAQHSIGSTPISAFKVFHQANSPGKSPKKREKH
jgi:hypothetical protein